MTLGNVILRVGGSYGGAGSPSKSIPGLTNVRELADHLHHTEAGSVDRGDPLVVGLPIAYWIRLFRWRWKFLIESVVALPLVLPPTVLGFYSLVVIGPHSPVGQLYAPDLVGHTLPFTFEGCCLHHLPGRVIGISSLGVMVRVTLDCGFPLVATVTRSTVEEFGLTAGQQTFTAVKAGSVHLVPQTGS